MKEAWQRFYFKGEYPEEVEAPAPTPTSTSGG
jgi:hypothetical protein